MSKWKMVPVEPTDQMIRAIDGLICSSYLWPVYAYRAMIDAAPVPVGDDCDDILDCYAAESQQFSDEIVSLRASVESARTKAIALESRRDAWRDSAILSQRSASELARQVDQQAAELARLRADVEDLTADRDSWIEQASARTADAVQFMQERDAVRAEAEVLRADALKQVDCRQCKHATNRGCHSTALCERGELFEATPPWQFYDAARAAQGGE